MRPEPPADTTHLYLIRHGATPANERRPYVLQGSGIDLDLSPTGERQVAAVARFLGTFPIKRVYSSPMLRARRTAQEIAAQHALPVTFEPDLVECHVGEWEGLDWETIEQRHPEACRRFLEDPGRYPYLGGESYADVARRVQPALRALLEEHRGESVVVVAHNVVNRVYLAGLLGLELSRAKDLRQQNGCINVITQTPLGTHVQTLNAVFHLDDTL